MKLASPSQALSSKKKKEGSREPGNILEKICELLRRESLGPKLELVLQASLHAVPQHQSLILQEIGTAEQNGAGS